jgi:hypothetical protein
VSEIYVVIGSPRSGTSLTAGLLHLCGVPMFAPGKAVYDNVGDVWNQGGHFADLDFFALVSPRLPGLSLPDPAWAPDGAAVEAIVTMVAERSAAPKWGFKGLHAWIGAAVLQGMGYDVRVINTTRPLAQSQASFETRTGELYKPMAHDFVAATKAQADAFYATFTGPKMLMDFEPTIADPTAALAALTAFAGVTPTQEAAEFVNTEWVRFS